MCDPAPMTPDIVPLGTDALLVRFADRLDDRANRRAVAFRAMLEAAPVDGVLETAPALGSVLVRIDPKAEGAVRAALAGRMGAVPEAAPEGARTWTLPCAFGGTDGPQLGEAAALAGMTEAEAVRALCAAPIRVLALGFAPGMPYLGILPPEWDLPRQSALTPTVEPGALVLAVRQMVLFGTRAPTGWRQVARTGFRPFDLSRPEPVALAAGDVVRLRALPSDEVDAMALADPRGLGGATVE